MLVQQRVNIGQSGGGLGKFPGNQDLGDDWGLCQLAKKLDTAGHWDGIDLLVAGHDKFGRTADQAPVELKAEGSSSGSANGLKKSRFLPGCFRNERNSRANGFLRRESANIVSSLRLVSVWWRPVMIPTR